MPVAEGGKYTSSTNKQVEMLAGADRLTPQHSDPSRNLFALSYFVKALWRTSTARKAGTDALERHTLPYELQHCGGRRSPNVCVGLFILSSTTVLIFSLILPSHTDKHTQRYMYLIIPHLITWLTYSTNMCSGLCSHAAL